MVRSYIKIAWANLLRNRMYGFINVGGLAVGMAVTLLISLWVYDEVSFNHSHKNYEHIAQVYRRFTEPLAQKTVATQWMQQPMAKVLSEKYGHLFRHVVLLRMDLDYTVRVGENNFTKRGQFIEDGVIDMFSIRMLKGSENSLADPRAMIISESTARALFKDKDPIQQTVRLDNLFDAVVTGVYEDIPRNSVFGNIQFFANYENLKASNKDLKANEDSWGHASHWIFVQTQDQVSVEQASAAIQDLYIKDTPEEFGQRAKKYKQHPWLYPMKDWYLYSDFKDGYAVAGRITFVWLFAVVGAFVLLLACINFMNLSTARSERRAKEVGIRKAIGSLKSQLVKQFLSESFFVVALAFFVSLLLAQLSLASFNELADKSIRMPWTNLYFWLASIVFLTLTSFLAGLYPAFFLSSFQPVKVLKGTLRLGRYSSLPRQALVVIQVTVSVVLVIGTIMVYRQVQYAQDRPVGYDREGLIRIPIYDPELSKNKLNMRTELLSAGLATDVAFSSSPVTAIWDNWGGFNWKGKNPEAESSFTVTWVDEDYGKTIQWKVLQGRDFSQEFLSDADAVIINKTAASYLGFKDPVGEFITHDSGQQRQIIGVVDDVVAMSPYEPVRAGFYWMEKNVGNLWQMQVKLNPTISARESLSKIESIQRRLVPSAPFNYTFVDEEYGSKFKAEQRIGKLASLFAVLAIFISCLGLLGLSSFVAEQKTKEIGIRKIVGASLFNIWKLLSGEFVVLVVIALFIAAPITYYYIHLWLQTYHYHTDLSPLVFVYAGVGALAITLSIVSFQSFRAATANPVKSLRSQ